MGPMSGWSDSVTPIPPPSSARPGVRTMAYAGLVTGGWAGLVCLVLYGIARLFGVPMEVDTMDGVAVVPWFLVLLIPVMSGVIGAIAALLLLGRRHAGRIVLWVGTVLAVTSLSLSLLPPGATDLSTKIWLSAMYVVTWLFIVPQVARIVGDSEPGRHAEREVILT